MEDQNKITYFGETDFRSHRTRFGIKAKDRTRHMYVIGKTGVGKSTLLENMAIQDIQNGEGLCVIDPHGGLAEKLLDFVPEHRINDVIYFAPFDAEYPMSFNVLEDIGEDKRHLVVSGLMSVFKKIWQDAWSARMEYILNNTLLALLEYPDSTLMGVNRMLSDKEFRKKIVENVKDPAVKSFWVDEYAKYTEKFAAEATPAIQNKIGQYTLNPLIRNIIGQPKSSFDIREIMDKKKIFIINLSKGRIGEQNMNLLGGMFVTKIYLAAMSRAELHERDIAKLPPFYFYVDEFQNFANESFAQILSEARKYKLALTVANQYVTQMVDEVRDAILGNVGTMVTFRIGPTDAEVFEKEFAPTFVAQDLTNLGFAQIYLRLMIDGMTSKPFSATTMPPIERPDKIFHEEIIDASRKIYAKPKKEVEELIKGWHEEGKEPPREKKEYVPREDGAPRPFNKFPPRDGDGARPSGSQTGARPGFAPRGEPRPMTQRPAPQSAEPRFVPKPLFKKEPVQAPQNIVQPAAPAVMPTMPPVVPPVQPSVPSKKMKTILDLLEKPEVGTETNNPSVVSKVEPAPIVSESVPVVAQAQAPFVPKKLFTKPVSRAASPESLSALREALGAVIKENKPADKSMEKKIESPVPVPPKPDSVAVTPDTKPSPIPPAPKTIPIITMPTPTPTGASLVRPDSVSPMTTTNEVPEDVLKKILE